MAWSTSVFVDSFALDEGDGRGDGLAAWAIGADAGLGEGDGEQAARAVRHLFHSSPDHLAETLIVQKTIKRKEEREDGGQQNMDLDSSLTASLDPPLPSPTDHLCSTAQEIVQDQTPPRSYKFSLPDDHPYARLKAQQRLAFDLGARDDEAQAGQALDPFSIAKRYAAYRAKQKQEQRAEEAGVQRMEMDSDEGEPRDEDLYVLDHGAEEARKRRRMNLKKAMDEAVRKEEHVPILLPHPAPGMDDELEMSKKGHRSLKKRKKGTRATKPQGPKPDWLVQATKDAELPSASRQEGVVADHYLGENVDAYSHEVYQPPPQVSEMHLDQYTMHPTEYAQKNIYMQQYAHQAYPPTLQYFPLPSQYGYHHDQAVAPVQPIRKAYGRINLPLANLSYARPSPCLFPSNDRRSRPKRKPFRPERHMPTTQRPLEIKGPISEAPRTPADARYKLTMLDFTPPPLEAWQASHSSPTRQHPNQNVQHRLQYRG